MTLEYTDLYIQMYSVIWPIMMDLSVNDHNRSHLHIEILKVQ